ncbi:MAG: citrate synthase/methylcitrate synthase [Deltaproteobacteria bacterium]|nr:citrate synthase/methylcitrate synthase [Deltaproteobacteria bacterium]
MTNTGLDGVVVAETELSGIDGELGQLWIAGLRVAELARLGFEDASARLMATVGAEWAPKRLGAARVAAFEAMGRWGDALDAPDGVAAVRTALAHASDEPEALVATAAVATAAWVRRRAGMAPMAPDASLGHAADLLRMMAGDTREEAVAALDRYLCTVIDHGLNASTFTARVVASTAATASACVVAAAGALSGPLHGGAPGPVLDMLDAIGDESRVGAWLEGELDAGRRIMGMGHRVYRVRDPRAPVLLEALAPLGEDSRVALARVVEAEAARLLLARKGRPMAANVEMATALLLEGLGVPREAFTAVFACSRIVGWLAHVEEQRRVGRILRPRARYVGVAA